MVGEGQVDAAAVDIDWEAEGVVGHGGTLDVPPGTALAPGGRPLRLVWLRLLPERKVSDVLLVRFVRIALITLALSQLVKLTL